MCQAAAVRGDCWDETLVRQWSDRDSIGRPVHSVSQNIVNLSRYLLPCRVVHVQLCLNRSVDQFTCTVVTRSLVRPTQRVLLEINWWAVSHRRDVCFTHVIDIHIADLARPSYRCYSRPVLDVSVPFVYCCNCWTLITFHNIRCHQWISLSSLFSLSLCDRRSQPLLLVHNW